MCRRSRETLGLLLSLRGNRASTVRVDGLGRLRRVLLSVSLNSLGCISGVLRGKIPELRSLLVGDVVALVELTINGVLVLDVDERAQVSNGSGNQRQAPERNELDEEVRDEGSKEGL
jgi:hypothetical protein